jgi:hypothetical protein
MEFLQDGENAILTEQNPEDLTNKVMIALDQPALRAHLKSHAGCPEQFLPEQVMKEIDALLGESK